MRSSNLRTKVSCLRQYGGLAILLLSVTLLALGHPDKIESNLLMHFATGVHQPEKGRWPDLTHNAIAKFEGAPPLFTNIGPALAVQLNGVDSWLHVQGAEGRPLPLPQKE